MLELFDLIQTFECGDKKRTGDLPLSPSRRRISALDLGSEFHAVYFARRVSSSNSMPLEFTAIDIAVSVKQVHASSLGDALGKRELLFHWRSHRPSDGKRFHHFVQIPFCLALLGIQSFVTDAPERTKRIREAGAFDCLCTVFEYPFRNHGAILSLSGVSVNPYSQACGRQTPGASAGTCE